MLRRTHPMEDAIMDPRLQHELIEQLLNSSEDYEPYGMDTMLEPLGESELGVDEQERRHAVEAQVLDRLNGRRSWE